MKFEFLTDFFNLNYHICGIQNLTVFQNSNFNGFLKFKTISNRLILIEAIIVKKITNSILIKFKPYSALFHQFSFLFPFLFSSELNETKY